MVNTQMLSMTFTHRCKHPCASSRHIILVIASWSKQVITPAQIEGTRNKFHRLVGGAAFRGRAVWIIGSRCGDNQSNPVNSALSNKYIVVVWGF